MVALSAYEAGRCWTAMHRISSLQSSGSMSISHGRSLHLPTRASTSMQAFETPQTPPRTALAQTHFHFPLGLRDPLPCASGPFRPFKSKPRSRLYLAISNFQVEGKGICEWARWPCPNVKWTDGPSMFRTHFKFSLGFSPRVFLSKIRDETEMRLDDIPCSPPLVPLAPEPQSIAIPCTATRAPNLYSFNGNLSRNLDGRFATNSESGHQHIGRVPPTPTRRQCGARSARFAGLGLLLYHNEAETIASLFLSSFPCRLSSFSPLWCT
ncbi:hypothetical protein K438DRAFT_135174 [Mycena galopus ATCC 62051]|nr:hypothetical protein K438DRAFT_135174 [Mycena galopus ATCC 62051]